MDESSIPISKPIISNIRNHEKEIERRHTVSKEILKKTGAHYVIDTIADLPNVVADINNKLRCGKTPRNF